MSITDQISGDLNQGPLNLNLKFVDALPTELSQTNRTRKLKKKITKFRPALSVLFENLKCNVIKSTHKKHFFTKVFDICISVSYFFSLRTPLHR